jgi:hypothetical protein
MERRERRNRRVGIHGADGDCLVAAMLSVRFW